ncbi:MAG: hypothetical protein K8S55_03160 [Phycisphaerae bacterium]|nr:hypothetical protein [Phycisphaerae bacterium]
MLSIVSSLTSFGAAGLMGALWLCERKLNRDREQQLSQSHDRIGRDEQRLSCLTDVVDKNTSAIVRFIQHQKQQSELIKHILEELHHGRIQ